MALVSFLAWRRWRSEKPQYVTATVSQGSIVKTVTATGTVNPVITVQVGTYVSGPITDLYVDFNSPVKAGQLMAKIDPRPFAATVALAKAGLANAKAQLQKDLANQTYQRLTYQRDVQLLAKSVISQDQLDSQRSLAQQADAQVALDRAAIQQQEASLSQAELNLNYTNIVSPVDGTVVSRNVDVGQTVAASFQTPTLFLVAKDLTKMQVDTNLSESDVGGVREGQNASFTVDAYPRRTFNGTVAQVRQAPITVQNVVTYDVVVNVSNPELLLKPGMTANVTIVTDRVDNVLRVPLQALRFSPYRKAYAHLAAVEQGGTRHEGAAVWVQDKSGLRRVAITRGIDDGTYVQVIGGKLTAGEVVVTDEVQTSKQAAARSPFGMFRPR